MANFEYINLKTEYLKVQEKQEQALLDVINGENEKLFINELDDVYTAGTSANIETDYFNKNIPLVKTGRGGQITYHGPGQIVAYPILNLNNREKDLKKYIEDLEKWIINTLARVDIDAFTTDDVGVWVKDTNGSIKKIAAIGIRVRKWVTFHGIALNVNPDLEKFNGIIPCGIKTHGVTSISNILDKNLKNKDIENILIEEFENIFK
ncbi:MAG TPA: lipoyl(octanoyl) transferase LipB [Alphaproteobacteria bacterium]|nr:lipoyl(octanoyl) transferase LipB [Alphaproteobacteria bacterium]